MVNVKMLRLNRRVIFAWVFFLIFYLVYFFSFFFMALGFTELNTLFGSVEIPIMTHLVVTLILLSVLGYWSLAIKKHVQLNLRRRRIVFIYSLIWILIFLFFNKYMIREIVLTAILLVFSSLHFLRSNNIKHYSTRVLMVFSVLISQLIIHLFVVSLFYGLVRFNAMGSDHVIRDLISYTMSGIPYSISRLMFLVPAAILITIFVSFVGFRLKKSMGSTDVIDGLDGLEEEEIY